MEEVTDEMILKWEKAVHYIYRKHYLACFSHLKNDLLQWGRFGVFQAYKTYKSEEINRCTFNVFVWSRIRGYMGHCIRHETRHEQRTTIDYDLSTIEMEEIVSPLEVLDIERAIFNLSNKERDCVIKWSNDVNFRHMGCNRETARVRFNKALKKLKRRLIVQ